MKKILLLALIAFAFYISTTYGYSELTDISNMNENLKTNIGYIKSNNVDLKVSTNQDAYLVKKFDRGTEVKLLACLDKYYLVQTSNDLFGVVEKDKVSLTKVLSDSEEINGLLNLINEERTKNNILPIKIDEQLSNLAKKKSEDIANSDFFSTTSIRYGTIFEMLKNNNIDYRTAGENIIGNIDYINAFSSILNSPTLKSNILNRAFNHIGISFTDSDVYGKVFVQLFVGR